MEEAPADTAGSELCKLPFYSGDNSQESTNDAGQREEVDEQQEGEVVDRVDNLGVNSVVSEDQLPINKGQVRFHLQAKLCGALVELLVGMLEEPDFHKIELETTSSKKISWI